LGKAFLSINPHPLVSPFSERMRRLALRVAMIRMISIIVFCTLAIIPIAGFSSNIVKNEVLLIVVTFGFGYIALPAMLLHLWPAPKAKRDETMEEALANGNLAIAEHATLEVAELKSHFEEARYFLAEVESGRTLCLFGEYMCEPAERGVFPSTRIRRFSNAKTGLTYGIESLGSRIPTWRVYGEAKGADELVDGHIYDKTIEQFAATYSWSLSCTDVET
jgi:hypothetical protein